MKGFNLGFTLAEVLITLGVIGVVAAITIPTLVQKYRNRVVETKLEKFYSNINQAITRAEVDHGDRTLWFSSNGKTVAEQKEWWSTYIIPYLQIVKLEESSGGINLWFADGSVLKTFKNYPGDFRYYIGNPAKCKDSEEGVCFFKFFYNPTNAIPYLRHFRIYDYYNNTFTNNVNILKNDSRWGCYNSSATHSYCGKLIQVNGWKIPDDYPYKVKY